MRFRLDTSQNEIDRLPAAHLTRSRPVRALAAPRPDVKARLRRQRSRGRAWVFRPSHLVVLIKRRLIDGVAQETNADYRLEARLNVKINACERQLIIEWSKTEPYFLSARPPFDAIPIDITTPVETIALQEFTRMTRLVRGGLNIIKEAIEQFADIAGEGGLYQETTELMGCTGAINE